MLINHLINILVHKCSSLVGHSTRSTIYDLRLANPTKKRYGALCPYTKSIIRWYYCTRVGIHKPLTACRTPRQGGSRGPCRCHAAGRPPRTYTPRPSRKPPARERGTNITREIWKLELAWGAERAGDLSRSTSTCS